ncbi:TPA: hypothetical protein DCZ39_07600 [Patescibacteria group bacterium]|nr:hypothetical protein [Candidatus Gracilibacteria bacterium]
MFSDQYIEYNGKKYFHIDPKEVLTPGMKLKYLTPTSMGELEILDILDAKGNALEKVHCNTKDVYILTDKKLEGREILYV